jgi:tetratricopeptide (TPR) repeat protein
MIQMLFFLRFQSQLRRTRPETISFLEKSVIDAVKDSGGNVKLEHRFIAASLDEASLGFWLDILTTLETILRALKRTSSELYGHGCIIGRDIPENSLPLFKALPMAMGTGIWCAGAVQQALEPYVVFEKPLRGQGKNSPAAGYAQIKNLKAFSAVPSPKKYPFSEKIQRALKQRSHQNTMLLGPDFIGKREGLYRFCLNMGGNFPSLVIHFGSGGTGLSCFSDALNPQIRSLINLHGEAKALEKLDALGSLIFKERLRNEYSAYLIREGRRFLRLLIETYCGLAWSQDITPIIILENLHEADEPAGQIFIDTYRALQDEKNIRIYGTCSDGTHSDGTDAQEGESGAVKSNSAFWEPIFSRTLKFSPDDFPALHPPSNMSRDLWEIAYAVGLLRRYFPGFLFPSLFEEEGKNPAMISRAFGMLSHLGIIDFDEDPIPRMYDFFEKAEQVLGERKEQVRAMVRNRLLAWVSLGKLRPCFNLLRALVNLGGKGTDSLILDALCGDLINGTYSELQRAINDGWLEKVTGRDRIPALLYISRSLKSLLHGNEAAIRAACQPPPPEELPAPAYKVQTLINLTSYHLGIKDSAAALELAKESMLICQEQQDGRGLAQVYRLFSLVNLFKQRLDDTIEYFSFAIENAEKFNNFDELTLAAYYAAGAYFLFGNISKAERLAQKAEQTAWESQRPEWADRSKFLIGKFRFETGRYRDALTLFEELQNNPSGPLSPEAARVLGAWIYRSDVFLRNTVIRKPDVLNGDALLFEIEASYLSGDYRQTVELSDRLQAIISEPGTIAGETGSENFLYIEQPDWRSGFAQCELFLLSKKELWNPMISAYRALALSRLDHSHSPQQEQAIHVMQRIINDERLYKTGTNDAFYFFAYYRILLESGAAEVDMNTAISMAFKRLQRRASRIDDTDTKRAFLSLHYWNGALMLAAKEHNLI